MGVNARRVCGVSMKGLSLLKYRELKEHIGFALLHLTTDVLNEIQYTLCYG